MHTLNIGILAHVDAGKTSLTECLLFDSGAIDRLGSVDAGDTRTDDGDIERQRGITIRSAVAAFTVGDVQINLIDTPGHSDFIAEVERALEVLDGAVLLLSAVEGQAPRQWCGPAPRTTSGTGGGARRRRSTAAAGDRRVDDDEPGPQPGAR